MGIKTSGDESWCYNTLRFSDKEKAEEYGKELSSRWFALNQAIKYHGGFYDGESHSWEIPKIIATKSLPDFKSIHEEGLKLAIIAYQKFAEEHYKSPKSAMIGFG